MEALTKQRVKQAVRRTVGEPYVGKRLKQRRLSWALKDLALEPRTILDAGSEDATFVYWLADRYPLSTVTAVDIDDDAIITCRATRPAAYRQRVTFESMEFAALQTESFDLITAFDVLEHIEDDQSAALHLARALRPGGELLVHVPRDQWMTRSGVVHRIADGEAWRINLGHVRQGYSPHAIRELLEGAGLSVRRVDTWLDRWGTLAHSVYYRLEHPRPLRLLSLPVTDLCAVLDARKERPQGNTVFAHAVKPI